MAALLEDRDLVAHLDRLVDVVGDEDDRLAQLGLQAQELVLEPLAVDRVDGAERLVHQHQRRVGRERAGDADALALAAGELGRVAVAEVAGEADQLEQLLDARGGPLLVPAEQLRARWRCCRRSSCAGTGRSAGSRSRSRAAAGRAAWIADALAADEDVAVGDLDHAVDHPHGGGLAAARRPDEDADLARGHLEREPVDGDASRRRDSAWWLRGTRARRPPRWARSLVLGGGGVHGWRGPLTEVGEPYTDSQARPHALHPDVPRPRACPRARPARPGPGPGRSRRASRRTRRSWAAADRGDRCPPPSRARRRGRPRARRGRCCRGRAARARAGSPRGRAACARRGSRSRPAPAGRRRGRPRWRRCRSAAGRARAPSRGRRGRRPGGARRPARRRGRAAGSRRRRRR